jgi:hypothetical protein
MLKRNPNWGLIFSLGIWFGGLWFAACFLLADTRVDVGDLLSFLGTAVAVGAAITGALLIEHIKKVNQTRERNQFIRDTIDNALAIAGTFELPTASEMALQHDTSPAAQIRALIGALEWLQAIRGWYPPDNLRTLKAYDEIRSIGPHSLDAAQEMARAAPFYSLTSLEPIVEALAPIMDRLKTAKALLN